MSTQDARAAILASLPNKQPYEGRRLGPLEQRPKLALNGDSLEHFIAKLTSERLTATFEALTAWEQVPAAAARYAQARGLSLEAAVPRAVPGGTALRGPGVDWQGWQLSDTVAMDQSLAISTADYAVAETGSLVSLSSLASPTLFAMLPLHFICVVPRTGLFAYPEDLWAHLRRDGTTQPGAWPRNLVFITGTSGTADIEAKNVRGAHGPRHLHVLLLDDEKDKRP